MAENCDARAGVQALEGPGANIFPTTEAFGAAVVIQHSQSAIASAVDGQESAIQLRRFGGPAPVDPLAR